MYLLNINRQWDDHMSGMQVGTLAAVQLTNTAKLAGLEGSCLLEFQLGEKRYHYYYLPGGEKDELRELTPAYTEASLERIFGISHVEATSVAAAIRAFISMNSSAIQTTVNCHSGLEQAMIHIRDVRLKLWN